jgi:predicted transcriptional regulator
VRRYWMGAILITTLIPLGAMALGVGDTVSSVQVKDANNNPAWIPDIGKKVISLFYTDPDVKDQNETFREQLKAQKFDETRYRGMGVANLKDTWKPNFVIRKIIRGKIEKFKSLILTDIDHTLRDKWKLGDCNEKDVVIIIGKDRKVKYIKAGPMSEPERKRALQLVAELIKK